MNEQVTTSADLVSVPDVAIVTKTVKRIPRRRGGQPENQNAYKHGPFTARATDLGVHRIRPGSCPRSAGRVRTSRPAADLQLLGLDLYAGSPVRKLP